LFDAVDICFLLIENKDRREMEASIHSFLEDAHLEVESEEYYKILVFSEGYGLAAESEAQRTRLGLEKLEVK
jgi:hypothetical protein